MVVRALAEDALRMLLPDGRGAYQTGGAATAIVGGGVIALQPASSAARKSTGTAAVPPASLDGHKAEKKKGPGLVMKGCSSCVFASSGEWCLARWMCLQRLLSVASKQFLHRLNHLNPRFLI